MSVLESLISVFAPHTCLECGVEEDKLVCEGCVENLPVVPSRCYRCKAVTDDFSVCDSCVRKTPLRQVLVATHYEGVAKELARHMKYERARGGMAEAAVILRPLLTCLPSDIVLVHVPTATSRVRTRGYDQAKLLARSLAHISGLPCRALLARVGQAHQVGAARAERIRQLQDAFRPVHLSEIRGKHIVLVDDVLTTGATLETAARMLRRAGAERVSAIVFAQA